MFDYSGLPKEFPRKFLLPGLDTANPDQLGFVFDQLEKRELRSTGDLEKWLWDESELGAGLTQEQSMRYIRMTCQTDDPMPG